MAIKAGTVGVNWKEVDNEGKIKDGGGGSGVTDVKVDGASVVNSSGVAEITLPVVPTDYVSDVTVDGVSVVSDGVAAITLPSGGGAVVEVSTLDEADFAVAEWKNNGSISMSGVEFSPQTISIDGTNYDVVTKGSRTDTLYIGAGEKIILCKYKTLAGTFLGGYYGLAYIQIQYTSSGLDTNFTVRQFSPYQTPANGFQSVNKLNSAVATYFTMKYYKFN